MTEIKTLAGSLRVDRANCDVAEATLAMAIDSHCRTERGTASKLAQTLGVSDMEISDIRRGRRRINDTVLGKLAAL